MKLTPNKLKGILDEVYPFKFQMKWDKSGISDPTFKGIEIQKVAIAMDITNEVIQKAKDAKCNLLITHHPIIDKTSLVNMHKLELLRKHKIAHLSLHTNFDMHPFGTSYLLACKLFPEAKVPSSKNMAVVLNVDSTPFEKFCENLTKQLGLSQNLSWANGVKTIRKVMVVAGNGTSEIENAVHAGCDILLTGDIKHHTINDGKDLKIALMDIGHEQEMVFVNQIASDLEEILEAEQIVRLNA